MHKLEQSDIIAHHYFDLDAEVVYDVVKNNLPPMLETIRKMIGDVEETIKCF